MVIQQQSIEPVHIYDATEVYHAVMLTQYIEKPMRACILRVLSVHMRNTLREQLHEPMESLVSNISSSVRWYMREVNY